MDPLEPPVPPSLKRRRTTIAISLTPRQKVQGALLFLMAFFSPVRFLSASDLVPFYVHTTRHQNGWRDTDVAIMFIVFASCMAASPFLFAFAAAKKSYWLLVFVHAAIMVLSGFGGFLMLYPRYFFPNSHIVVPFSIAMGTMGLSMDRANVEAWIPELVTSNGGNQKQIAYWTGQGTGLGYLVITVIPPILFEFLGFQWNVYSSIGGAILPLICLMVLVAISEPISERAMRSMSASLLSESVDEDEPPEIMQNQSYRDISPSLLILEAGATWSQGSIQWLFAYLLPAVVVKQLNTHVSYISISGGFSVLTMMMLTYVLSSTSGIFAKVNCRYPLDIIMALTMQGVGFLFFGVLNFDNVAVAFIGLYFALAGFVLLDTFEAPQRTLLTPPLILTKVIGIVNGGKRSLRLVVAAVGPFLEDWSAKWTTLICAVGLVLAAISQLIVYNIRLKTLEKLIYLLESDNISELSQEVITRTLSDRKKQVSLPFLEMEQMKYAGLTYDMVDSESPQISFHDFDEFAGIDFQRADSSRAIEPDFAVPILESFNVDFKRKKKKKNDRSPDDENL